WRGKCSKCAASGTPMACRSCGCSPKLRRRKRHDIVLTDGPLTQLRYVASRRAALPSPTRGEGIPTAKSRPPEKSRFHGLLPLWEKVPEGRMRVHQSALVA